MKTMTGKSLQAGQTLTVRAPVYVRISDRAGAGLGVARQEEDCRALCGRLGWQVARVYPDNDVSAYSGRRPGGFPLLSRLGGARQVRTPLGGLSWLPLV